jgi:uncharacterized protein CbrC (UPF0167 family)
MPALEEITRRTPGFSAWQQDHWLYHCALARLTSGQPYRGADLAHRAWARSRFEFGVRAVQCGWLPPQH